MASDLPVHSIHQELADATGKSEFDVFISGSGPIGATYARLLVDQGLNVVMVEIGDQESRVPASHKKNDIIYQKDVDKFVRVIQGALSTCSISRNTMSYPSTLDPQAWRPPPGADLSAMNGRNPFQEEHNNLGAEAVTRCVGGMATHWTCATPEFHPTLERPKIFADEQNVEAENTEWKLLYDSARAFFGTSSDEFEHSIRHNAVLRELRGQRPDLNAKPLPLACHRLSKDSPYVWWHAADNVYGDLFTNPTKKNKNGVQRGFFRLLSNTRCSRLIPEAIPGSTKVSHVEVQDLLAASLSGTVDPERVDFAIKAKTFVLASGAVATPQILAKSGFGGAKQSVGQLMPNVGVRITEQPMTFCQIVLRKEIVEKIKDSPENPDWWKAAVAAHIAANPKDPLPIPFRDPEPQVNIPVADDRPWHAQIHRDAFSYGEAGPQVDPRVVVDLRFFGLQKGVPQNRMYFEGSIKDEFGMPQPTFEYNPTEEHALQATAMMKEMTDVANILGGYLPGSYPQFMTPGLALHLGGTVRLGHDYGAESVADFASRVWQLDNLFVAGNGVIPTPFAANPTLTSMALAIRSAYFLHNFLTQGNLARDPQDPTPREWVNWAYDKTDPNYPDPRDLRRLHRTV